MINQFSRLSLAIVLVTVLATSSSADEFAGKQWPASKQVSIDDIKHDAWNTLLQKYVDDDGMVDYKAWHKTKINLDSIEHQVLRKMDEPRIHFAIVCASIGCPRLLNEAYTSDKIENQLKTNSTDFFSRSQNLQVDAAKSKISLSTIMSWFATDFGDTTAKQIETVAPYFPDHAKKIVTKGKFSVDYLDYNWKLNER